jgi:hypothetical protein
VSLDLDCGADDGGAAVAAAGVWSDDSCAVCDESLVERQFVRCLERTMQRFKKKKKKKKRHHHYRYDDGLLVSLEPSWRRRVRRVRGTSRNTWSKWVPVDKRRRSSAIMMVEVGSRLFHYYRFGKLIMSRTSRANNKARGERLWPFPRFDDPIDREIGLKRTIRQ